MNFCNKTVINFGLKHTTILKINDEECMLLSQMFFNSILSFKAFSQKIAMLYNIKIVIVTLGSEGCYVKWENGDGFFKTEMVNVKDTIGAGDAFSAAFLAATLCGKSPSDAAVCGNLLGAFVASQVGALPEYDDKIMLKLSRFINVC